MTHFSTLVAVYSSVRWLIVVVVVVVHGLRGGLGYHCHHLKLI